jgi:hypothetical protein
MKAAVSVPRLREDCRSDGSRHRSGAPFADHTPPARLIWTETAGPFPGRRRVRPPGPRSPARRDDTTICCARVRPDDLLRRGGRARGGAMSGPMRQPTEAPGVRTTSRGGACREDALPPWRGRVGLTGRRRRVDRRWHGPGRRGRAPRDGRQTDEPHSPRGAPGPSPRPRCSPAAGAWRPRRTTGTSWPHRPRGLDPRSPSTSRTWPPGTRLEREALCGFVVRDRAVRAVPTPMQRGRPSTPVRAVVRRRDPLLPGHDPVWDGPRPPRLEATTRLLRGAGRLQDPPRRRPRGRRRRLTFTPGPPVCCRDRGSPSVVPARVDACWWPGTRRGRRRAGSTAAGSRPTSPDR